MWYLNVSYILAIAGMVIVLMLTRFWPSNKRILLLVFNLCFLWAFSKPLFVFYLFYTLLNYAGYLFLSAVGQGRKFWFVSLIALNVAGVAYARFVEMDWAPAPLLYDAVIHIGLIYNVLKVIDAYYFAYYMGREGRVGILDYFNFILFIPTFTSGPILKFRDFIADTRRQYEVNAEQFEDSVKRIILGLFKKIVLVAGMMSLFQTWLGGELHPFWALFLMIWFYVLLYLDFSGYSDIAIGFGRLMGYTVPENFKKPFLSPSLTQYWRNWHASLGDWFRDHIFMIFGRNNPTRWKAAALSFVIMVLIGLWHGFTLLYLLWGIYHGLLLALENILHLSTVNKRKVSKPYFYFRCLTTQALVLLAVIVYSGSQDMVLKIYRGLLNF